MNRMITKKKRSLKRVYRVKSRGRSHVKSRGRGRGRGRFRKHTMRGGLGRRDGANIKITDRFSFANARHIDELALFTFGTPSQRDAWTRLLDKCLEKNVPVYILTAGNRVGIIRTLQLLNMDHYFREVLGTYKPEKLESNATPAEIKDNELTQLINPKSTVPGDHDFHGMSKYEVISTIIEELSPGNPSAKIGCLLDDDESNQSNSIMAPTVKFLHTKPREIPKDYKYKEVKSNVFYKLRRTMRGKENTIVNITPIRLIDEVTNNVDTGTYNIVFIDFDETFYLYDSAFPLHNVKRLDDFSSVDRTIHNNIILV